MVEVFIHLLAWLEVKWLGHSRKECTWEPFDSLHDCAESIEDYGRRRAHSILGNHYFHCQIIKCKIVHIRLLYLLDVRMVDGRLQYLVKYEKAFRNGEDFGIYTSDQAKFLWPKKLANFLEGNIVWTVPQRTVRFSTNLVLNRTANPTGQPLEISCMYLSLLLIAYRSVVLHIMY